MARPRTVMRPPGTPYRPPHVPLQPRGRAGPAGDGMRWLPPRLQAPPPRPGQGQPPPAAGRAMMTGARPAMMRHPGTAAPYRMPLRPRIPGQV